MDATGHAPFLTGSDATLVHSYNRENYTGHWRCAKQQRDKRYIKVLCFVVFVCLLFYVLPKDISLIKGRRHCG